MNVCLSYLDIKKYISKYGNLRILDSFMSDKVTYRVALYTILYTCCLCIEIENADKAPCVSTSLHVSKSIYLRVLSNDRSLYVCRLLTVLMLKQLRACQLPRLRLLLTSSKRQATSRLLLMSLIPSKWRLLTLHGLRHDSLFFLSLSFSLSLFLFLSLSLSLFFLTLSLSFLSLSCVCVWDSRQQTERDRKQIKKNWQVTSNMNESEQEQEKIHTKSTEHIRFFWTSLHWPIRLLRTLHSPRKL